MKLKIESVPLSSLVLDPANARRHSLKNIEAVKGSLARFGQQKPIVVGKNNVVIAGNGTLEAARALGWESIDVHRTDLTGTDAVAFAIADNRTSELAEWDGGTLGETLKSLQALEFDLGAIGFDADDLAAMLSSDDPPGDNPTSGSLANRFGVPPFSVLDARQGYWQDRKRGWLSIGIQSELGRGGAPGGSPRPAAQLTGSGHTRRGDGRGRTLA